MKLIRIMPLLLLALSATLVAAQINPSFDKLKTLAGTWEGKNSMGQPVKVTYRVTSQGSALMSEIDAHGEDMISMFHTDGDRLLMTHYCGAGNQPRMKGSASADGKTFPFEMVDVTNLSKSQPGHMQALTLKLADADHHSEEWVFQSQDGKEMKEVFELQRVK